MNAPDFPRPDRSGFEPNFRKTADDDVIDIGWTEGVLSDGRPYRLECWAQDQVTCVTIFVSSSGLEGLDREGLVDLLEREDLVRFPHAKRYVSARPFRDAAGNDLLSINVVVGDEEETYTAGGPALRPYPRTP